ncbi:MAG: hypothetical protein AB7H97_05535, partial [Pseudobdellovibrionaceae bacterium]
PERSFGEKVFLFLFVVVSGWLLYFGLEPSLRFSKQQSDTFEQVSKNGEARTATIVSKREEYVENRGAPESSHPRFYVTLELIEKDQAYRSELRFQRGYFGLRKNWEELKIGESVWVQFLPAKPENFYAPSFLEGTLIPKPALDRWLYVIFAVFAIGLILFLVLRLLKTI